MRGRSSTLHYSTDITVFCDGKYKNLASLAGTGFWGYGYLDPEKGGGVIISPDHDDVIFIQLL